MSYVGERYAVNAARDRGLSVYQCGWQKCNPGHVCQRAIRTHYSMHFILKGGGVFESAGRECALHAGEGFLITPYTLVSYRADLTNPWEYVYVAFFGTDADALMRESGFADGQVQFRYEANDESRAHLDAMVRCGRSGVAGGYDILGHFLLLLSPLIDAARDKIPQATMADIYLTEAMRYMRNNYAYRIGIADVASYVGIDRSYLYRLFKERTGKSPQDWLLDCRLERADELIARRTLSLTEIAHSVGFSELAHFSHAYKRARGHSPKEEIKRSKDSLEC